MIDWTKELDEILEHPLFANVTAPKKRATSSDRLVAAFQEVCDFYEKNGTLPDEQTDRQLFHKFNGILKSEAKIERCRPFDTFGILPSNEGKVEEPQVEMEPPHELTEEEQLEPTAEGGFELRTGSFYNFCKKAEDHPGKDFFFIIDEIHRGNLSKIYGELLMLIENSYRGHSLRLAYRNEQFSVPENVFIIGMMNTQLFLQSTYR